MDSCICERHFRREDLRYPRVFIDGPIIIKPSLVPSAMPIPIDNVEEKYGSKRPSFDVGSNKKKKKIPINATQSYARNNLQGM